MPESTYIWRTNALGTQTSSTFSTIGPTHSRGIAPNSHGWITARRPDGAGPQSGGHWWRTSACATCGSGASALMPVRSTRWTRTPSSSRRAATARLMIDRLVVSVWSPTHRTAGPASFSGAPRDGRSPR